MAHEGRSGIALALASLLHLGLIASGVAVREGGALVARSSSAARAITEIDVEIGGGAPRVASESPTAPMRVEAAEPRRAPVAKSARAAAVAEPAAEAPATEEAPAAPAEPTTAPPATTSDVARAPEGSPGGAKPGTDEWGGRPPDADVALPGLGGDPVWKVPGAIAPLPTEERRPAPTTGAPPPPVDPNVAGNVLRGTLERRDGELGVGIPAAGLVATTIASVVRSSEAPEGRATFEVKLGARGEVLAVRLVSSSSGTDGTWRRVTGEASAAIANKGLRMGPGSEEGATVVVSVESSYVYPAGTRERTEVEPVCAEEVLEDAARAAAALGEGRDPAAAMPPVGRDRKICIPIGIRGRVDPSNIAAHKQKVVKTKFHVVRENAPRLPSDVKVVDTKVPWLQNDPNKARMPRKKWDRKTKKWKRERVSD